MSATIYLLTIINKKDTTNTNNKNTSENNSKHYMYISRGGGTIILHETLHASLKFDFNLILIKLNYY